MMTKQNEAQRQSERRRLLAILRDHEDSGRHNEACPHCNSMSMDCYHTIGLALRDLRREAVRS
jgi:hypothetical protein